MSANRKPLVVVLAGPNGAGKSSAAASLLPELGIDEFVNADVIAAGLSPSDPQSAALPAGRIMLQRLGELIAAGRDFALESTLSGRAYQRLFAELAGASYDINLYYLWLPSPDMSLERVRGRVRLGGHDIPESDIRRRYARGIENFYWIYRPMASRWLVQNGNAAGEHREVAEGRGSTLDFVHDPVIWSTIQRQVGETNMTSGPAKRVREVAVSRNRIQDAFLLADREVILRHRAGGVPLVFWRDGKVVHVDPNAVDLPEVRELAEHTGT